jgi:hypothetical protein
LDGTDRSASEGCERRFCGEGKPDRFGVGSEPDLNGDSMQVFPEWASDRAGHRLDGFAPRCTAAQACCEQIYRKWQVRDQSRASASFACLGKASEGAMSGHPCQ